MEVGDLIRIIKSGQIVFYLGMVDDCYKFWHPEWQMCYFNPDTFPPDKYEVLNESR